MQFWQMPNRLRRHNTKLTKYITWKNTLDTFENTHVYNLLCVIEFKENVQ